MSDDQPTEFETLGPEGPSRGSRRTAVIAAVAVAVVAVLGGGAYAAYSFLDGGGAQPADVLPDSTVAVVSVDLDPSAGQKIAAIKSIRRFPTLKKSLGLQPDDDLRKYIVDKIAEDGDCADLDFDKDVKPWLGKRAAFAGVDLGGHTPAPALAIQVSDPDRAKTGFEAIVKCADADDFAFVVGDDYLIASDTADHARTILELGKEHPLTDDAAYQKWTGEAGDAGVLNFYVAKRAAKYAVDLFDELSHGFSGALTGEELSGEFNEDDLSGDSAESDPFGSARDALADFKGLGGTVRFAGGGMELSVAGGGVDQLSGVATIGRQVSELPADTAVALGFGVPDDYAKKTLDRLADGDDFVSQAEKETGLDLPDDLQTLLGDGLTLSLGGDAPASLDDVDSPADIPAGIVLHGDAQKIQAIIAKVEDHLDMHLADVPLVVKASSDEVAVATSEAYAADLLARGSLGSEDGFEAAVPNADKAAGIFYVDFDSTWRDSLVAEVAGEEGADSAELEANLEPLRSLGVSSWQDGDVSHALFKLTTH